MGGIGLVVDTDRYPLAEPGGDAWNAIVARTRRELADSGCSLLPDFIRPAQQETLRAEGDRVAPLAYYDVETVNVYNIDITDELPAEHPGRVTMQRGNAFVARDHID